MNLAPVHPIAVQGPLDPDSPYVILTWDRNDPDATGYRIYRNHERIGTVTDAGGPDDWDKRYWKDTTVFPWETYFYQVVPMYGTNPGPQSKAARIYIRANHPSKVFTVTDYPGATLRDKVAAAKAAAVASAPTFEKPAVLYFPAGTHTLATADTSGTFAGASSSNIIIRGAGKQSTMLRPSYAGSASESGIDGMLFHWAGSTTALPSVNPTATVARGTRTVTLNDASAFSVGDVIALNDMTNPSQIKSADENENYNPWDSNEVVGKSGNTITVRYPWAKPFPVGCLVLKLDLRGNGIERCTIEGDSSTTQTYYTLLRAETCADFHAAEVRGRWCNRNVLYSRGFRHTLVSSDFVQTDPRALAGESLRYDVTVGRSMRLRVIDCVFGDLDRVGSSMITTQVAHKQVIRHCRFYRSENYAWNEHGGASFWNVFENNYLYMPEATKGGVFLGNSSFFYSCPTIVRANLFDTCATAAIASQQNSWGINVLHNHFRDCPDDLINWYGMDHSDMLPDLYGSARWAVRGNQCHYTGGNKANRGYVFGYDGGSNPYPGVRDLLLADNEADVDASAVRLGGTSSESFRLQVVRTTGTNDYVRPTLVPGDHWADNQDENPITGSGSEGSPFFADTFPGSAGASAGWPIFLRAPTTGNGTDFTISSSGNYGRHSAFSSPAGSRKVVTALRAETMHDSLVICDFRDASNATARIQALVARHPGVAANDNHYRVLYEWAAGSNRLRLEKVINGVATVLAQTTAFDTDPTADLRIKFEVTGTTVRAKCWPVSGGEPGSWTLEVTDATLVEAGKVGCLQDAPDSQTTTSDYDNYKLVNWTRNAQQDFGEPYDVSYEAHSFAWQEDEVELYVAEGSGDPRDPDYVPPVQSGDAARPCSDPLCIVCGHGDPNVYPWYLDEELVT